MSTTKTYTTGKIYPYGATPCSSDGGQNVGLSNIANIYDNNTETYAYADNLYWSTFGGNTHWRAYWNANSFTTAGINSYDTINSVTVYIDIYPTASKVKWSTLKYTYSIAQSGTIDFGSNGTPNTSTVDKRTVLSGSVPVGSLLNGLTLGFKLENTNAITQLDIRVYDVYLVVNYTRIFNDITFTTTPVEGGQITGATSGSYARGTQLTVSAIPAAGYKFNGWILPVAATTPTRTITVTGDATYLASFIVVGGTLKVDYQGGNFENSSYSVKYSPLGYTSLTLNPATKSGYKFVGWSYTNNSGGSFTVSADGYTEYYYGTIDGATDTLFAIWEPIYITYDSIFNFQKWKDKGITSDNGVVSNISDIGFEFTASADDAYTRESPAFPVTKGQNYTLECNVTGGPFQIFVFNCPTLNGDWGNMPAGQQFTYKDNETKFEFSALTDYITIRCDSVGTGTAVTFENIRIYPSEFAYMSTTVSSQKRHNTAEWNMPTPVREGYLFVGWNAMPEGKGEYITAESDFPTNDIVLYSQWVAVVLPSISSVQITPNPCDAGQGFIISVGFTE